jgi:hypothetical protein
MPHRTLDAKAASALVLKEMYNSLNCMPSEAINKICGLVSSEPIKLPEEIYLVSVR